MLYIGTKGKMLQDTTGTRPRLLPVELHNSAGAPPERMPRVPNQAHEMNWVNAIQRHRHDLVPVLATRPTSRRSCCSASRRMRAGTRLQYDGAAMRVTNHAAANDFLTREYRQGFGLS